MMDIPELTIHCTRRSGRRTEEIRSAQARRQLTVYLTPRKYLEEEAFWKRAEMFKRSQCFPLRLELVHDLGNRFDPRALGVFYEGIRVGYIRKHFYERDDAVRIDRFCFEKGVLREDVELYCEDHVLHLKRKQIENSRMQIKGGKE